MSYSKIHQYIERRKRIREREQRKKDRKREKELEREKYFSNFKLPTLEVVRDTSPIQQSPVDQKVSDSTPN